MNPINSYATGQPLTQPQGFGFMPVQDSLQKRTQIANNALDGSNAAYRAPEVMEYFKSMLFEDMRNSGQPMNFEVTPIEIRYLQMVGGMSVQSPAEIYQYFLQNQPAPKVQVEQALQQNPMLGQVFQELSGGMQPQHPSNLPSYDSWSDFAAATGLPSLGGLGLPNTGLGDFVSGMFGPREYQVATANEGLPGLGQQMNPNVGLAAMGANTNTFMNTPAGWGANALMTQLGPLGGAMSLAGRLTGSDFAANQLGAYTAALAGANPQAYNDFYGRLTDSPRWSEIERRATPVNNRSALSIAQADAIARNHPTQYARHDGSAFGPDYFGAIGAAAELPSGSDRTGVAGFRDISYSPFSMGLHNSQTDGIRTTPQYDMNSRAGTKAYQADFDAIEREAFGSPLSSNSGSTARNNTSRNSGSTSYSGGSLGGGSINDGRNEFGGFTGTNTFSSGGSNKTANVSDTNSGSFSFGDLSNVGNNSLNTGFSRGSTGSLSSGSTGSGTSSSGGGWGGGDWGRDSW